MNFKSGVKTLLFGYHQFLWHPYTLYKTHIKYIGKPSYKMIICFFIHDIGYINIKMSDMDSEFDNHPELGAKIASKYLGEYYYEQCLYHSRDYAKRDNKEPSLLCWVDKLATDCEPLWFSTFRCFLSNELKTRNIKKIKRMIVSWKIKAIDQGKLEIAKFQ